MTRACGRWWSRCADGPDQLLVLHVRLWRRGVPPVGAGVSGTELVIVDTLVPAVVFSDGGVDKILSDVEAQVRAEKVDISTVAGRKACASLAHKVARSKTALDDMGKALTADLKAQTGRVDAERRKIRDRLDALKDEVRLPLTEWENAETRRAEGHESAIRTILNQTTFNDAMPPVQEIQSRILGLDGLMDRDWQEFSSRAKDMHKKVSGWLEQILATAIKREAEAAEADRLRKEEAERSRVAREEQIAAEAAARATLRAEANANAAKVAAQARAERDRAAVATAQRDAMLAAEAQKAAEERAERAVEDERRRVAAVAAEQERQQAVREKDRKHKAAVNNEALDALVGIGLDRGVAGNVVVAIAKGKISHVSIKY